MSIVTESLALKNRVAFPEFWIEVNRQGGGVSMDASQIVNDASGIKVFLFH